MSMTEDVERQLPNTGVFVAPQERTAREYIDPTSHETFVLREYFGRARELQPGPQGFFVERHPPHVVARPHFHPTDQFQVFLPSPGAWYQRHPITAPTL